MNAQNEICNLIRKLTPSEPYRDILDFQQLKLLSNCLRQNHDYYYFFFQNLKERSEHKSLQVRFLCFQLLHYFFSHSSHFRFVFNNSNVVDFLNLFCFDSQSTNEFQIRLNQVFYYAIQQWMQFSKFYPQICILNEIYKDNSRKAKKIRKKQNIKLLFEIEQFENNYTLLFEELKNLMNLLKTKENSFMFYSDDYKEIVFNCLKEHNKQLNSCIKDVDLLVKKAKLPIISKEIKSKIHEIENKVCNIVNDLNQIGIDDDDFTEDSNSDDNV